MQKHYYKNFWKNIKLISFKWYTTGITTDLNVILLCMAKVKEQIFYYKEICYEQKQVNDKAQWNFKITLLKHLIEK